MRSVRHKEKKAEKEKPAGGANVHIVRWKYTLSARQMENMQAD